MLRIACSAVADPSLSLSPPPPPALDTSGGVFLSVSPKTPLVPGAEDSLATAAVGSDGGGGGLVMPMLACGVSATLVMDVAAISVALTDGGVNVAAVAVCAAHCKVNVSDAICCCFCRCCFMLACAIVTFQCHLVGGFCTSDFPPVYVLVQCSSWNCLKCLRTLVVDVCVFPAVFRRPAE